MDRYEEILAYLQEQVDNGSMSLEEAEVLNEAAFEKYNNVEESEEGPELTQESEDSEEDDSITLEEAMDVIEDVLMEKGIKSNASMKKQYGFDRKEMGKMKKAAKEHKAKQSELEEVLGGTLSNKRAEKAEAKKLKNHAQIGKNADPLQIGVKPAENKKPDVKQIGRGAEPIKISKSDEPKGLPYKEKKPVTLSSTFTAKSKDLPSADSMFEEMPRGEKKINFNTKGVKNGKFKELDPKKAKNLSKGAKVAIGVGAAAAAGVGIAAIVKKMKSNTENAEMEKEGSALVKEVNGAVSTLKSLEAKFKKASSDVEANPTEENKSVLKSIESEVKKANNELKAAVAKCKQYLAKNEGSIPEKKVKTMKDYMRKLSAAGVTESTVEELAEYSDEIFEAASEVMYELAYIDLQEQLDNGEISLENAEILNEELYNEYFGE